MNMGRELCLQAQRTHGQGIRRRGACCQCPGMTPRLRARLSLSLMTLVASTACVVACGSDDGKTGGDGDGDGSTGGAAGSGAEDSGGGTGGRSSGSGGDEGSAGGSDSNMGGGAGDGNPNPCDELDCGDHGSCDEEKVACVCGEGEHWTESACVDLFESPYNLAFLSPVAVSPDFGGLEEADELCNQWADAAGAPGSYRAILSAEVDGDVVAANSRLAGARGWVRRDGLPIADEPSKLFEGGPWTSVHLGPDGNDSGSKRVWTGSDSNGSSYSATCDAWTSADPADSGAAGYSTLTAYPWLNHQGGQAPWSCGQTAHLYCMGVDKNEELDVKQFAEPGLTFVMFTTYEAQIETDGGVEALDAICQEAAKADPELADKDFLAFVAQDGVSAIGRFSSGGNRAIVRPDGLLVAENLAALAAGEIVYPGNLLLDPPFQTPVAVLTGSTAPDVPGTLEGTCQDWTSTSGDAAYGIVASTSNGKDGGYSWFSEDEYDCDGFEDFELICLEAILRGG